MHGREVGAVAPAEAKWFSRRLDSTGSRPWLRSIAPAGHPTRTSSTASRRFVAASIEASRAPALDVRAGATRFRLRRVRRDAGATLL